MTRSSPQPSGSVVLPSGTHDPDGAAAPLSGTRVADDSAAAPTGKPFGVYVHIPFCSSRCDYCAFATWTDRGHLMEGYAAACVTELQRATLAPATSVFFGGGTPSLLPAELLVGVLEAIDRVPGAEVTVECNPETVTGHLLDSYRKAGVTRLSFGAQSMVPAVLASLGRQHHPDEVRTAVALAGEHGFGDCYNVDLIYGAVGETLADWRTSLETVLAFDPAPSHLSAYALTVEAGTPLGRDRSRYPDDDDQADKYLLADRVLSDAGLGWYEVSNWARPGRECRHNQLYWQLGSYRGVGCAAHSHLARADGSGRRWWNVRTPERYQRLVESGNSPEAAGEEVRGRARLLEELSLGLRTREGIDARWLPDDPALEGLVVREDDRVTLTRSGRLLVNEVILRLAPDDAMLGT